MSDRDIHKALMADPFVRQMAEAREVFWINPHKTDDPVKHGAEWKKEIAEAEEKAAPVCALYRVGFSGDGSGGRPH